MTTKNLTLQTMIANELLIFEFRTVAMTEAERMNDRP
jgi:hypothetical protein